MTTKTTEPVSANTIIATVVASPLKVLQDPAQFELFCGEIKKEIAAQVPDLTTVKGREVVASFAYQIARCKGLIDDAGKKLNEDRRKEINVVDAARREVRDRLDALRDEAREPLTLWEAAEADRKAKCETTIAELRRAAVIEWSDTSDKVINRLTSVQTTAIDEAVFRDQAPIAQGAKDQAIATLTAAVERLEREEADRAELERLRKEKEERDEVDAAQAAAAARARPVEPEPSAPSAAPAKIAETPAAAAANPAPAAPTSQYQPEGPSRAHVAERLKAAKEAIMAKGGVDNEAATLIVRAIAAGSIPNVSIQF